MQIMDIYMCMLINKLVRYLDVLLEHRTVVPDAKHDTFQTYAYGSHCIVLCYADRSVFVLYRLFFLYLSVLLL